MSDAGINLDYSIESVKKIDKWFPSIIKPNEKDESLPNAKSFSICNDLSMYLGAIITRNCPMVEWKLNTIKPSDVSYHRPVLMGFNVRNKNYNVDFDLVLCQYSHRILKGEIEDGLLVKMIQATIDRC